jgi:sortase B
VEFNFNNEEDFQKYVESFRERSTFKSDVQVQPGDKLISLCTCAYVFDNARYLLMGRLVPLYANEDAAQQPAPPAASPAANG